MVRSWMFRFQTKWLVAMALLGRHTWGLLGRLLRESIRSFLPKTFVVRAKSVAVADVTSDLKTALYPFCIFKLQAT